MMRITRFTQQEPASNQLASPSISPGRKTSQDTIIKNVMNFIMKQLLENLLAQYP